jgi:hypothetical protein
LFRYRDRFSLRCIEQCPEMRFCFRCRYGFHDKNSKY